MFGGFPVNAGIGDGDTVFKLRQIGRNLLIASVNVALQHDAANRFVAVDNLGNAVVQNEGLQVGIFHAVGVRAVDNDAGVDAGILEGFLGQHHAHGIKVRTSAASAEH